VSHFTDPHPCGQSEVRGYTVRSCRGHWHVVSPLDPENPEDSAFDLALPGDPFHTKQAAIEALFAMLEQKAHP
jgi:hypothetical protein